MLGSQAIRSILVSIRMIFETLQSELFRFKFHSLGSKIRKTRNSTKVFIGCFGILRGISARNYGIKMHPKKTVDATPQQPSSISEIGANSACSKVPRNTYQKYLVLQIIPFKNINVMKFLEIFELSFESNNSYKSISYASNLVTFNCIKF